MCAMTRPASDKPAFSNWLVAQRKARPGSGKNGEMTTAEMRAAIAVARGFKMGHSTYAQLESGSRKPTAEQYAHITGYLAAEPPPEPAADAEPASDLAALVSRLDRLAAAMEEQNRLSAQLLAALDASVRAAAARQPGRGEPTETGAGR